MIVGNRPSNQLQTVQDDFTTFLVSGASGMDWSAIALSLRLATATTLILLVIGLPLASWLVFSNRRGRWAVDALVALPLVLPPTVLGFYVLVALGPRSPIGRAYEAIVGSPIVFSFEGLLVASVLYSLPFAVQPFAAAFAAVDRNLIETAWCLGASRLRTFARIVIPLARPGILAGAVLTFPPTVGEFRLGLVVGWNLPGSTRT